MKFQFKVQDYQTDAVDNVVNVFAGQPNRGSVEYVMDQGTLSIKRGQTVDSVTDVLGLEDSAYKNADILLTDNDLLKNINHIQGKQNIKLSPGLSQDLGRCSLDVEMETGTGKTYVYIKTMFELNKRYGWTKFIVVVPSIAIREGVKKSFEVTVDHFMEQYGKKARFFVYNSSNLNQIETFSNNNDISVMIINTQAFNTSLKEGAKNQAANIIYNERDEFASRKPIDVISANKPIIILDEPQKMGGKATQTALKRFNPLFTLNYSATHKQVHNPVYVLDALDAFNKRLVKKIEVVGFEYKHLKGTDKYVYLEDINLSKVKPPQAVITFEVANKSGSISRKTQKLKEGDDLFYLSGEMNQYKGFLLTKIIPEESKVEFSNGESLLIHEAIGDVSAEQRARIQIRETIKAHFHKEKSLYKQGIKTLSLFFLDEVANYRQYDEDGNQLLGKYGEIFEEEYLNVLNEYLDIFEPAYMEYLKNIKVSDTHEGYFSIDKKGHAINSETKRGSDQSDDISAYDLILKNKEDLLSFMVPVRFIFSHSALREGWDNPNVFQICSLRQSNSISQKRQEVGRGLRICVDKNGVRMDKEMLGDRVHAINCLTVVASEGYATFVDDLQKDIKADLYERPTKVNSDYFVTKVVIGSDGQTTTISKDDAEEIHRLLRNYGYIDKKGAVTDVFREDLKSNSLKPLEDELAPLTESVYQMVQGVYDDKVFNNMIVNANKPTIEENRLTENFNKAEFQSLWKKINHKYAYKVSFDSEELIQNAVGAIDAKLTVTELTYTVTKGTQQTGEGDFERGESKTDNLKTGVVSNVKYDLIGAIAKGTVLTRRTVATILTRIKPSVFAKYRLNPEEFISKSIRLILEQKATMIVDHISYNQIEGCYDSDIFTQEKHGDYNKAFEAKKSIVPFVFTDGLAENSVERRFLKDLESAEEVVVYAKLPKGFHIPTPVGNYSPDWAIAFKKESVKHVFFVAETKGSMSSMDLRQIEKDKTECARKLFNELCSGDVKYGVVDSYDALLGLVRN